MEKNMIELNKLYKLCTLCKELKLDKKLFGQLKKTLYEAEFILESKNEQLIIKILNKNIEPGVPVRELENHPNAESIVKAIISTMTSNEINMISFDCEKFNKALYFFWGTVGNILDDIQTLEDVIALYSEDKKSEYFYMLTDQLLYDYERKLLYAIILNIHHLTDTSKNADISMQKMINYLDHFNPRVGREEVKNKLKDLESTIKNNLEGDWLKSMRDHVIAHIDVKKADNSISKLVTDFDGKFDKIKCISKDLKQFNQIIWLYFKDGGDLYCQKMSPISGAITSMKFNMNLI